MSHEEPKDGNYCDAISSFVKTVKQLAKTESERNEARATIAAARKLASEWEQDPDLAFADHYVETLRGVLDET